MTFIRSSSLLDFGKLHKQVLVLEVNIDLDLSSELLVILTCISSSTDSFACTKSWDSGDLRDTAALLRNLAVRPCITRGKLGLYLESMAS